MALKTSTNRCCFPHENITRFKINKHLLILQLENLSKGQKALTCNQMQGGSPASLLVGQQIISGIEMKLSRDHKNIKIVMNSQKK